MKMNFFHLLTVAVVPSCRAYIKRRLLLVSEKLNSLGEDLNLNIKLLVEQLKKKIEYTLTGDYIIYFTFSLMFHFFLQ